MNEVLVYGIKIIDVFVLKRVWDDYYFQQDSGYDDYKKDSYKKELFKFVPESKVTMDADNFVNGIMQEKVS